MSDRVFEYRVQVYSAGRWLVLGTIRRPGPLLAAWKGAQLGVWPSLVARSSSPGVRKPPS